MNKVAIIGYGIEGKQSAKYFRDNGNLVTICDANEDLDIPSYYEKNLGKGHLNNLEKFDVIVRTAGIHPAKILQANPQHPEILKRITTSLNEFLAVCPSHNIIGITGTKGKGTTCTLVKLMLDAAGVPNHLGGNIGKAPLTMLKSIKPNDWVILELSSFQLIDIKHHIPLAVCLVIYPEHLNWHADMAEYLAAKANLFKHQLSSDTSIYDANSEQSRLIASAGPAKKLMYDVPKIGNEPDKTKSAYVRGNNIYHNETLVMALSDVALPGRYNLANICAAISIVWPIINGDTPSIVEVVSTFKGLAHHMEYVTEIDGVKYINDSYSTMPDATIAAIETVIEPKVLILGGYDKKLPFDNMIKAISKSRIRQVLLIGSLAKELQKMLNDSGMSKTTLVDNDMESIILACKKFAQPGDTVLLSPGCAAKGDGYFIDNVDRGNQFKRILSTTY